MAWCKALHLGFSNMYQEIGKIQNAFPLSKFFLLETSMFDSMKNIIFMFLILILFISPWKGNDMQIQFEQC